MNENYQAYQAEVNEFLLTLEQILNITKIAQDYVAGIGTNVNQEIIAEVREKRTEYTLTLNVMTLNYRARQIGEKTLEELTELHPTRALSYREEEVIKLVDKGYTDKQIASQLFISGSTVRAHMRHILEVLHASNRTEAAYIYRNYYRPPLETGE